jgi:hypothetical protein
LKAPEAGTQLTGAEGRQFIEIGKLWAEALEGIGIYYSSRGIAESLDTDQRSTDGLSSTSPLRSPFH